VIAVSHHTRRELADWYQNDCPPLHMVYNAFGFLERGTQTRLPVRQQLGISDNTFLLGFAGRLTQQKGLGYLLDALQRIRRHNVALVIVGDGPLRAQLQRQVQQCGLSGMVHFVGSHPNVWPWLREVDAGILPSLYEGLPTAAVELMVSEKPVIATAVNGTPEVVRHCETGILVPARDPASLAKAIRLLAGDPKFCRKLGRQGCQLAERMFSPSGSGRAVRDVYSEITSKGPVSSTTRNERMAL
jgi:glycosyltransferase involved in cell wall biosynthesis